MKDVLSALHENKDIIEFVRDNASTKDDIANMATKDDILILDARIDKVRDELKQDIKEMGKTMIEHVDGFVALYQKHEVELAAVVSRQNRFEKKLDAVIKHVGLELA